MKEPLRRLRVADIFMGYFTCILSHFRDLIGHLYLIFILILGGESHEQILEL